MTILRSRTYLLVSISAVVLMAATGLAAAQDKGGQAGGGGPAGQTQAPAAQPEMKGGGDSKGDLKGRADTGPKAAPKGGQAEQRMDQKGDPKGDGPKRAADDSKQRDQKGAQDQRDNNRENRAQEKLDRKDSKDSASDKKSGRESTGQGAAGRGGGSITTEQRTRITTTIRQSNVRPVTNLNVNIRVGAAIPRTVTLNPLPSAVIEVYPDWRGYRFILVGNDILVIDPDTYEIVAVLDA